MERTGNLWQIQGVATYEWNVKDLSSLPATIDMRLESHDLYFCGTTFTIQMYPNGLTQYNSDGYTALYLMRRSPGSPIAVDFSFAFKMANGNLDLLENHTDVFRTNNAGYGFYQFILRSKLIERKCELLPSDTLTVICTLKNSEQKDVTGSLFNRLQELRDDFREVFERSEKTNFQLKVHGRDFYAHQLVLKARSPVFASMLKHDMKESQTGEVFIPDIEASAIDTVLNYMYSGDIDDLTTENVLSLYAAAHKYDLKTVKEMCVQFIIKNLSVKWICDVITFAEFYEESDVRRFVRKYFEKNASDVLETDSWDEFMTDNHDLGVELLTTAVKRSSKRKYPSE